ncbi:MAG: hypothetical protein IJY66_07675, partial [Clostridia bacterium]|nr:hypothetical protein [Clostridia bacterium]
GLTRFYHMWLAQLHAIPFKKFNGRIKTVKISAMQNRSEKAGLSLTGKRFFDFWQAQNLRLQGGHFVRVNTLVQNFLFDAVQNIGRRIVQNEIDGLIQVQAHLTPPHTHPQP